MADAPTRAPKAAIIVLAAGASQRLGPDRPKQLLPFRDTTLLAHAAGTALAARIESGPVVVVLGHEAERMRAELSGLDVEVAVNAAWREGMGASVRCGVAAVEKLWPGVKAVAIMTCDQPLVPPRVIRELAEIVVSGKSRIAACGYGGAVGVPAAFARRLFPSLLQLEGDRGARALLLARLEDVQVVPCPEAAVDIDTDADAAQLG